jgi:hypothetical protein
MADAAATTNIVGCTGRGAGAPPHFTTFGLLCAPRCYLSLLFPATPGPEDAMEGRPLLLVTVIFVQIVVTLWAVLVGRR